MIKGLWWANSWKLFYVKSSFRNINNFGSPDNNCSKCALLRQISMMHIFSIVFYFFTFLPFMQNYWYFNEKCLMIGRKIAKGDLTCHNKPHFCFLRASKWWCSLAYGLLKRKIIFAALLIFFFLQKICYLGTLILRYVFHRNIIYSHFCDILTDIWYGTGCVESM